MNNDTILIFEFRLQLNLPVPATVRSNPDHRRGFVEPYRDQPEVWVGDRQCFRRYILLDKHLGDLWFAGRFQGQSAKLMSLLECVQESCIYLLFEFGLEFQ